MFYLTGFHSIPPRCHLRQEEGLEWLAEAHVKAKERLSEKAGEIVDTHRIRETVRRYGCGPESIGKRGSELGDFSHRDWDRMDLFPLTRSPQGAGIAAKNAFFKEAVQDVFERFYPDGATPPDDLIHVTCTGYHSPSPAQALVEKRNWGERTLVTHAYHMGCYAAFPALRIAAGCLLHPETLFGRKKKRVDVVHTELCTLHLNPSVHTPEQIVVQSLFADGFIKYSVVPSAEASLFKVGLEVLSLREEIIPRSLDGMSWTLDEWGMKMSLSREVPVLIMTSIRGFLKRLFAQARISFEEEKSKVLFAIHPGGPLILDLIAHELDLEKLQLESSRKVLFEHGNISSAALPHIWREILDQRE